MSHKTRVDLHCHSSLSDGTLEPEDLVERLADLGVAFAALTDHDMVEGLARFRAAASRRGIACISGVEMTVRCGEQEAHLLAYGFDPDNAQLQTTLRSLRRIRQRGMQNHGPLHSIADNLRQCSANDCSGDPGDQPDSLEAPLDISRAIEIVHSAGGKAFLAHPLLLDRDRRRLRSLLDRLKTQGLDGIEALYAPFTDEERLWLCEVADEMGLLVSAGADQHAASSADRGFGIDMPTPLWRRFRQAVTSNFSQPRSSAVSPPRSPGMRQFALHIVLPTVLAIALFVGAIFGVFLPTMERTLLDRKREMIRELTNSAWSTLSEAHREELAGLLTRAQAQEQAKTRIESMRYGRNSKDYFWLQDMHPRIVMHPYRKDLNGKDVKAFRDARGTPIFVEFADLVRRQKEGYVEYVWQWNDDPARLSPKESYIHGFEPWGWIIGTGIYIDDVKEEIARMERGLVYGSGAISVLMALLLCYVMRESLRLERKRSAAQRHLHESSERYRRLVEAASEGTLLVLENRCRYANPMLLEMLGLGAHEMELMDLEDLLGAVEDNVAAWQGIAEVSSTGASPDGIAASLRRRDGSLLKCRIALRPIELMGRPGLILLARPESVVDNQQRRALMDRLLQLPSDVATDLACEVSHALDEAQVARDCRRTDRLVRSMLDCGAHPRHVTQMVASVCDAATARLVQLAMVDLGPAPASFALVALGSQGRQEQTLCTDQDNAIIYSSAPNIDAAAVASYFHQLGQRVCDGLAQAGYARCRGGVMASNPQWSQPLCIWKRYFSEWIDRAEPRELLDFSIFFDFRAVYGDAALVAELRTHVQAVAAKTPAFLPHFAQNVLLFKPPLGLFGRIVTGTGGENAGMLDLKSAMMPIVSFARLYALRHVVPQTGTLERLATLAAQGVLLDSTYQEMLAAYESLMRLRLRHQSDAIHAGLAPNNLIDPQSLGHIEKAILKESFAELETLQHRVSYDFLGGANI